MKKLKYSLVRRDRKTGTEFIVARFYSDGDALWAATVFEAHKVIGQRYQSYVTDGKAGVWYPSATLPVHTFNIG